MRAAIRQILFAETPFSPLSLFRAGEQGVWYDPSDQTTLFATHDGTTPGVAVGNPVGKILDKSGRGNHATQSSLAARPTLQVDENGLPYLLFDGIDDCLFTSTINFTATDKMTVWAGARKLAAGTTQLVELSAGSHVNNGAFSMPQDVGFGTWTSSSKGTISAVATSSNNSFVAPVTTVNTGVGNISGNLAILRVNAAQVASASTSQGTGNYGNYPIYIGSRGNVSLQWHGRLYSLIVRGAQSTNAQITQTEAWVNRRTRAY